jgi:flagellar FliJ protein
MEQRSKRLKKIVVLAEIEEQQACIGMRKTQRALDEAVNRLDELSAYQNRYQSAPLPSGSVGAARWQDYQQFLSRLGEAIKHQQQLVSNSQQALDVHRRRWQEKRKRVGMLEQIMQRYRKAEEVRDERLMQKAIDDLPPSENLFEA